jgi:hypothetical protein
MRQKKLRLSRLFLEQISVDIHRNSPEIYFNVQITGKISITARGSGMEYDSPWKEAVEDFFEEFLLICFPDVHKDIDFSKGYNYRIFDKFQKEVVSLALLTDDNPNFRPNEYVHSRWGFQMLCRYPLVKLIDYRDRLAELEASTNPFAIIIRAYLKTLETAGNVTERYSWKKRFLLELYRSGMKRETILAIQKFIDWMMELPEELEDQINKEVESNEEKTMPYTISAERIARKKGLAQGITTVLKIKFGEAGQPLGERTSKMIYKIKPWETFQELLERLTYIQSLSEAEKLFDEVELQNQETIH